MGAISVVSAEIESGLKDEATAVLATRGLTMSDALRILTTRLATDQAFIDNLMPVSGFAEKRVVSSSWDDFFDRPGIDIEEPEDPAPSDSLSL